MQNPRDNVLWTRVVARMIERKRIWTRVGMFPLRFATVLSQPSFLSSFCDMTVVVSIRTCGVSPRSQPLSKRANHPRTVSTGARVNSNFFSSRATSSTFDFQISKRWPWRLIEQDATVQPTNDENDDVVLAEVMDEFSYGFRPRGKAGSSETRPTQNELKNIFIRTTLTANLKKVTNGWDDSRPRCSDFPDRTLTTSQK